jgi:acyl carrier protein
MNLIVALEEEFGIIFTDDEMTELLNMELIASIISDKIN